MVGNEIKWEGDSPGDKPAYAGNDPVRKRESSLYFDTEDKLGDKNEAFGMLAMRVSGRKR